ncbi:uncharacterized protein LOC132383599 isoform X1 [Hypanus sabinus]|uniref:uncharacterized protein LOC132383599 isoform X1 n=1 Tax=Hypanus sabinus TaxID=79690 RepID=UPI0028C392BE|nr:uncharacterized protein LOC132383599 isoform X1 [Hypanus sabinus]XP_059810754.1 uncharacterized protein LOC132383599 isoform X1 [Hypanus sabinus]XP_059810755.1 uncharacterized protein LOC132383599 isoform X1 [Hypanus sabinus]XP_059810756.1 uncharacterized protein LOC132383599 isoform X1 [Hypanus sabinus]XP_059810757.1 uncharacterized protein LOC132383599 isoform X1 [Hypanus sabinus]XP_059810758.1 uncharacterized protein LOC132383599 isoform X1 [Hypanus sabinus]
MQLQIEQMKLERCKLEMEQKQREFAYAMEELKSGNQSSGSKKTFVASQEIKLVPPFSETEVERYFQHFGTIARMSEWPKDKWSVLLQSVIKGKAQQVYTALTAAQALDYDIVKSHILNAYELVPEAYRERFRSLKKSVEKTYVEFAYDKAMCFERWVSSKNVNGDYDTLRELILMEEFKRSIPVEVRTYLNEKDADKLQDCARLADEYVLIHKNKFPQGRIFKRKNNTETPGKFEIKLEVNEKVDEKGKPVKERQFGLTCNYCKKSGHVIANCFKLKKKEKEAVPDACVQHTEAPVKLQGLINTNEALLESDQVRKGYDHFVTEGFVSLKEGSTLVPIKILRDTGASQSLMLDSVLKFNEESDTGEVNYIRGVGSDFMPVHLHKVNLKSGLVTGFVKVGLQHSLPVKGISLLLGNDLAGGQVFPEVHLTMESEEPELNSNTDSSCVVTRAMAKKIDAQNEVVIQDCSTQDSSFEDVSETFLSSLFEQDSGSKSDYKDLSLSTKEMIAEQNRDSEIIKLREQVLLDSEIDKVPVGYYLEKGVLMRKWRSPTIPASEDWNVVYQVVVPKAYRNEILTLAHSVPLGGHQGVRKTVDKILKHFYWPGLRKDVAMFCKTCHTCQIVGKPNQVTPIAPFQPIPAFGEPFSKVIVDCVGPLPKTKTGYQYLLTIMCTSSRFPEAVPLRNIKAKTVTKALINFFLLILDYLRRYKLIKAVILCLDCFNR